MTGFAFGGLALLATIVVLALLAQRHRARESVWLAASKSAGLEDVAVRGAFAGPPLTGRAGHLRVHITSHARDWSNEDTRIVVETLGRGIGAITLRPEGAAGLANFLGGREIEIGDPSFDEAFFISGPPSAVYACLDSQTRALLFRLNEEGRLEVAPSGLRLDIPEAAESRLLASVLGHLLGLARHLDDRAETAERLAANARADPRPTVRLQSLLCLTREFPEHPVVAETLRAACSDRSPEVRLRAAAALGLDGHETLLEMTDDMGLPDVWTAAAVAALGRKLPIEHAKSTLERALHGRRFETARACVEALAWGGEAAIEPLVEALGVQGGMVAAAAARSLGGLETVSVEGPLIRALEGEAPGVRVAAAEGLGRSGSAAAVLPLKKAAEHAREPAFRRAARQAVAEIQARLPGASPGQLSLAAPGAGQLSLAGAEVGRLSLAEGKEGPLHSPPGEPGSGAPSKPRQRTGARSTPTR